MHITPPLSSLSLNFQFPNGYFSIFPNSPNPHKNPPPFPKVPTPQIPFLQKKPSQMSLISPNEAQFQLTMVVEYLESSMSKDLLCKFPDNSAFDFDYTQSSIWSPLLPRSLPDSSARGGELSRKLSYYEDGELGLLENVKTVAARIKRRFSDAVSDNCISRCCKMKRRKRKSFGFSPVGSARRLSSSSPSPKLWGKVIKAAAKHFKKRKNKKKDSTVNLDLSNYLTNGNL